MYTVAAHTTCTYETRMYSRRVLTAQDVEVENALMEYAISPSDLVIGYITNHYYIAELIRLPSVEWITTN